MRHSARVPAFCALALALSATTFAQNPDAPGQAREKRGPNQVVDTGRGDAQKPVSAEDAASAAADLERQFGKRAEGIAVTVYPDGTLGAALDESFMEAMTVTRAADGSLQFGHVTGLANASAAVAAGAAPAAPVLEEK